MSYGGGGSCSIRLHYFSTETITRTTMNLTLRSILEAVTEFNLGPYRNSIRQLYTKFKSDHLSVIRKEKRAHRTTCCIFRYGRYLTKPEEKSFVTSGSVISVAGLPFQIIICISNKPKPKGMNTTKKIFSNTCAGLNLSTYVNFVDEKTSVREGL